jgi:hypothetical protein
VLPVVDSAAARAPTPASRRVLRNPSSDPFGATFSPKREKGLG